MSTIESNSSDAVSCREQSALGRETIARMLASAPGGHRFGRITVNAPFSAPGRLLDCLADEPAVLWHAPSGDEGAGLGSAGEIEIHGAGRIPDLRGDAAGFWGGLVSDDHDWQPSPRMFGGLSFAVGGGDLAPWKDFSDGAFWMPRWFHAVRGEEARLTLTVDRGAPIDQDRLLAEYDLIMESLARTSPRSTAFGEAGATLDQMDRGEWRELVESIRLGITGGRFQKIVAARRSVAHLDHPVDVPVLLRRLRSLYPGCYRFAFRRGATTFLGATPERLIRKKGSTIWTEALAGSIASPGNGASGAAGEKLAETLLASAKDRAEHAIVVDQIRRRLSPLCKTLSISEEPGTLELRQVIHLHTPIRGELEKPMHILDLVGELHPTPSVGGVPTDDAVDWIGRHERDARGWYAGPIGWCNEKGDGEFAVALRCGLVEENRVHIYAGAGIVLDSDPDKEYDETDVKQQALLRALGMNG